MDEPTRSYMKREMEEYPETIGNRAGEGEEREGSDKKKHSSSKSRKHYNTEETEDLDNGGKRRSTGDRNENRRRSGGSSRAGSGDEEDDDTTKELRYKQQKKIQDERNEKKAGSGYDRELESKQKGRDVSANRGHPSDEVERSSSRKTSLKPSGHESSQSKSKGKEESSYDNEPEKVLDRDSRYLEKGDSNREKGQGSRVQERNPRRRWDESDSVRKSQESNSVDKSDSRSVKTSDVKHGNSRDRTADEKFGLRESMGRGLDSNSDKGAKSSSREEKRVDRETSKSRSMSEVQEQGNKSSSMTREERSGDPRDDKHRRDWDNFGGFMEDVEAIAHRSYTRDHGEKSGFAQQHLP